MNRTVFATAFALGLAALIWIGVGFIGTSWTALLMTLLIAAVYLHGARELQRFRAHTAQLHQALDNIPAPLPDLGSWLEQLPAPLRQAVRLRVEGERATLPGPALTPYLVGLLVMLGMLGTFLGMVMTFKGAVFALEGSADLQAIRSALAAPIKGLGLSFGTSVAGVATSAMLGLMATLCRRERQEASRLLDQRVASVLRPFSHAHQRQASLNALQAQTEALPAVVDRLHAVLDGLEQRSQQLSTQLASQQDAFHREVKTTYTDLAAQVRQSLLDSLTATAQAAGDSLRPVVASTMQDLSAFAQETQRRQADAIQAQLQTLITEFNASAKQQQAAQAQAESERLQTWTGALQTMAANLHGEWQRLGEQSLQRHQGICAALEQAVGDITQRTSQQAGATLQEVSRLLERSEELVRHRTASEAQWLEQHAQRMDQLAHTLQAELGQLRTDEAARGQAAVDRLGELQAAVASHLATLGTALEAPLSRLLQTASEVPQAAAQVIAELRQEMSRLSERDNLALEERTRLATQLQGLIQSLDQAAGEQRSRIEALVGAATQVLAQAGTQFEQTLQTQATQLAQQVGDAAAQVNGSAVELAALGEAFGHGVQLYSASNDKLLDTLARIESAIQRSITRSDEQLDYYVAQAREVIDLSITSQQSIVQDLQRLRGSAALEAEGAAG